MSFDLGDVFEFAAPILGGIALGPIGAGLAGGLTSYARHGDLGKAALSGAMGWGLGSLGQAYGEAGAGASDWVTPPEGGASILKSEAAPEMLQDAGKTAYQNMPWDEKLKAIGQGITTANPIDIAKQNPWATGAAGLGLAGMMAPQQATIPGAQAKTGYAPRYTYNPQTRQYETAAASPYTYYAANGGSVPNTFPQSNIEQMAYSKSLANPTPTNVVGIPSSDYDARINQQGDVFTAAEGGKINSFKRPNMPASYNEPNMPVEPHAAGGSVAGFKLGGSARADAPYQMSGKSSGIYSAIPQGPIYGVDSSKVGPYENADAYASVKAQMDKMSPSMLDRYAKGAKDPIVMAAAQQELYERENTPQGYFTQPTMAQGGTIKMADGGLPGIAGLFQQLGLFGPQQQEPVKYDYDPNRQYYTKLNSGGVASLGGEYAAGGKLLQGPGDGMSDSIPAVIKGAKPQRAALAQGEFVVPADVVSHLGNGSTDAGAKRLYAMMDKVRMARTGNKKQGRQINPEKFMPA